MSKDIHSLSYTRWNFKYHVVFAPKYRRIQKDHHSVA